MSVDLDFFFNIVRKEITNILNEGENWCFHIAVFLLINANAGFDWKTMCIVIVLLDDETWTWS